MINENLTNQLNAMLGKTFMYKTINYKILGYAPANGNGEKIIINTNVRPIELFTKDGLEYIKDNFLPVATPGAMVVVTQDLAAVKSLHNTILDNIEKIKKDKSYIEQAQAINESIDTYIDLAKTEIDYAKTVHKIQGGGGE